MKKLSLLEALLVQGYKSTIPRQQVAAWIQQHDRPFSVAHLIQALPQLDRVSVYRTVELLSELDLVHPILQLNGHQLYEAHEQTQHHHHVICTDCEKSACLPCEIPEKKIRGFKNLHHAMHFTSLCTNCSR